ncbi:VWA domain-containing protein [Asticcacaulis sp. SL142]|uniref:TadE/TadG family type IV pilus assembly protein n=1 Tax=Asticcacaulis sp. SL142 TaxID=2995155 RepID=UPI00226CBBBE|nr:VWA domain-containing protein [Asticcacaulis sp. SL142]WAC49294.1 VWA domain-containing protein [Asticcacaulis sp. SL142]
MALVNLWQRFRAHNQGNVAIIAALSALPILAAVGAGTDAVGIIRAKSKLQDAADSAAIAGALVASSSESAQEDAADAAFQSNVVAAGNLTNADGELSTSTQNNTTVKTYLAAADVNTLFVGMLQGSNGQVRITASANAGVTISDSEIVFVLDNTGSMSRDSRMVNLKSSVDTTLASLVGGDGTSGGTKVAIVPFDTQVNIKGVPASSIEYGEAEMITSCSNLSDGRCSALVTTQTALCASTSDVSACTTNIKTYTYTYSNNGKSYIRVFATSYYYKSNNGGCSVGYSYYNSCNYMVVSREATYQVSTSAAGSAYNVDTNSTKWPQAAYYNKPNNNYSLYSGTVTSTAANTGGYGSGSTTDIKNNDTVSANADLLGVGTVNWNGCVIDRIQPYDASADSPDGAIADKNYPASKCATNNLLPVMGLTTDIQAARDHVQKMSPAGNTNVTIGVQWGMEVLSPGLPFNTAVAFGTENINKYMIIVTDGQNTQNRWTTNTTDIDARTLEACKAAKAQGITIFTVRVMEGNSSLLEQCATRPDYYYNLSNASELSGALGSIVTSIKKIRLTK